MHPQHDPPPRHRPELDRTALELAARAHHEAARLAESHGYVRSARDYAAFSIRVREALRRFDSTGGR